MTPEQESLILDNRDLIHAAEYRSFRLGLGSFELSEIQDEAQLALVKAAAKFDSSKSPNFRGYASTAIKRAVVDYIRKSDSMTRDQRKHFNETGKVKMIGVTKWGKKGHAYHNRIMRNYERLKRGWTKPYCLDVSAFKRDMLANGIFF